MADFLKGKTRLLTFVAFALFLVLIAILRDWKAVALVFAAGFAFYWTIKLYEPDNE